MASPCRIWFAGLLLALTSAAAAAQEGEAFVITVNNTSNAVNGDTANIPALIATPGADGISFIEALKAANGTEGTKVITFSEELTRTTIEVTSADERQLYAINTTNLTIDGDLDRNGTPDITFVAPRNTVVAFFVRSSRVTIRGLRLFFNFAAAAIINVGCPDLDCDQHIKSVEIAGNEIVNVQGSAIRIGPENVRPESVPFLAELTVENLLIRGNTITCGEVGVSLTPSVDALSGAIARNIRIENNTIAAVTGVWATAAHRISPPRFGENNLIDGLTIDQNTFDTTGSAITVFAADYGNSNNRIHALQITANQIRRSKNGIEIAAAFEGKPQRVGSGNVVENVTIANNQVVASARGVTISGADLPLAETEGIGFDSNRVRHAAVTGNTISGYSEAGVRLWGGLGNGGSFSLTVSRNSLEDVNVSDNVITGATRQAAGIAVFGGEARGGSVARENSIRGLAINRNRITGNGTGVLFVGGTGPQAQSNMVEVVRFDGNILEANDVRVTATENSASAGGNSVRFPRRRAVR